MVGTFLGLDQHLKAHQKAEDVFAAIVVNDAFVSDQGTAPRQRRLNLPISAFLVRLGRAQELRTTIEQLLTSFPNLRLTSFLAYATFAFFTAELSAAGLAALAGWRSIRLLAAGSA
jgi:hypothetical protein